MTTEPHPLFKAMIFACCKCTENSALYFFCTYACKNCHLQLDQSNAINLLLQEFSPCSMPGNIHVRQTYSLHKATSTYTSHVLVSASLRI